jgi:ribose-phosphate pyrophosphokinase
VIPYLGYARQDRKMTGRVPISARLVADLLETAGVNRVLTMDLHAGQIQGFFNVPLDHLHSDRMLAKYIYDHHREWLDNLTVASPDVGGVWRARRMAKRLGELVPAGGELPLALVVMQRDEERKKVVVKDVIGTVAGRDVLLVDDILSSGETLITAAKEVMREGAKRVFAACTHGVFSRGAMEILNTPWLQRVLVTDTIAHRDEVRKAPQIEIVSVAEFFADAIRRIHCHESMTDLLAYMPT